MMYQFTLFIMGIIASVLVIIVGLNTNNKNKATQYVFLGSIIVIGVFYAYAKYTCGPNSADVKIMKPMVEKISTYIIKKGIPESLKDIPDLPYELEGCEQETTYGPSVKTYFYEGAQWKENLEICNFKNIIIRFRLSKSLKEKDATWNGSLEMDSARDTGLWMAIEERDHKNFYFGQMSFSGSSKGICNPMRQ